MDSIAAATREATLLAYAKTFDKHALARGHLARWAKDLQDLADAIPDTHGLMIHTVWSGLHAPIRRQISPNHASWDTFSSALRDLKHGIETTPTSYWEHPISQRTCSENNTPYARAISRQDPDPSRQKKRSKARSISPAHSHVSDSDDEDIDTTIVLETEILTLDDEKEQVNYESRTEHEPIFHVLSDRAYSAVGAMQSAGMKLTGLVYDARKTIMNLGTVFVEVPNGPSKHRGFKIGYAIEFLSHVLCWNSFDNNFRMHWRLLKRKRKVMKLLMSLIQFITIQLGVYTLPSGCVKYSEKGLNS
ncbi:hypothetical protein B0H10DRAFT_1968699 [Mycena sp. CBHHK59/15]|nr:hypothetical protein B0H10DRAFT_1968699 [Mycena sp. CBHHK59/15]